MANNYEMIEGKLQELFDADTVFPGMSVGVLHRDNRNVFCYGYGDLEENLAVGEEMPFHLCSISKWVTALAVMILCEKEVLSLDKNVNDYLHDWKIRDKEGLEVKTVTLRHLLSHTSGIVDGEDAFTGYRTNMGDITALDILEGKCTYNPKPARAEHPSGKVFEYSDTGYVVIQLVIENVMKQDFEQVMKDLIFLPLQMKHTFYGTIDNFEMREGLPTGYDESGKPNDVKQVICPDFAAAGLWSTPSDMLILAKEFIDSMHDKGKVLPKEYIIQMLTPQFADFGWAGMGTFFEQANGFVSKGWGEDAQSMLFVDYEQEYACIVMGNCEPGVEQKDSLIGKIVMAMEDMNKGGFES